MLVFLGSVFSVRPGCADGQTESEQATPPEADYLTVVKPLLRDKCFSCHGSLKQEGGLRLDAASLIRKGGESGPAYQVGAATKSLMLQRITADDDSRMPPPDEGARLTTEEVAKLTHWIDNGAVAPDEAILHYNLGNALKKTGQLERAEDVRRSIQASLDDILAKRRTAF